MTKHMNKLKAAVGDVPPGVTPKDLTYPQPKLDKDYNPIDPGECLAHELGDGGRLNMYKTDRFGWCICTLRIGSGRGQPDRTYGVRVDGGGLVTMGRGPHVKAEITLYIRRGRAEALKALTDLYTKGMADAGNTRDRIGSRRAQGQLMRAEGRTSWRWDT